MRIGLTSIVASLLLTPCAWAEDKHLPPPPEGFVELAWSTQFANSLISGCESFRFKKWDPRLFAFMDSLVANGVDLANRDQVYAPPPPFNGASAKMLFANSNIADASLPVTADGCDIAELVFNSDMLTAAMLDRVKNVSGS